LLSLAHFCAEGTMDLFDVLDQDSVYLGVPAASKEDLLERIIRMMEASGRIADREQVKKDLLQREELMSTGVGSGVAIPHAHTSGARELAVAVARTAEEVDFDALDGSPVRLVFMIVAPRETADYLKVLARISRLLYSGTLQKRLMGARSAAEVIGMISEEERMLDL